MQILKVLTVGLLLLTSFCTTIFAAEKYRRIETSTILGELIIESFPEKVFVLAEAEKSQKLQLSVPESLLVPIAQILHHTTGHCGGFVDITNEPIFGEGFRDQWAYNFDSASELPSLNQKDPAIEAVMNQISGENIEAFTKRYSATFKTRLASVDSGKQASEWLKNVWQQMARDAGRDDIIVEQLKTPNDYIQKNVRITIPGRDSKAPIVILGAHLDSINIYGRVLGAPGSDDDGSGIAALTEVYFTFLKNNFRPNATVQIFGYAAEEVGLVGSRAIAQSYFEYHSLVRGVMQLDMIAWPGDHKKVTFMRDYVHPELTTWTEKLYTLYTGQSYQESSCGYACSDHASWNRYGFPSVMPFETTMNDMNNRIHKESDVWDQKLDADFAALFAKLAFIFVAELSK